MKASRVQRDEKETREAAEVRWEAGRKNEDRRQKRQRRDVVSRFRCVCF